MKLVLIGILLTTFLSIQNEPPGPFPEIEDWNTLIVSVHHGCGRAPPSCPIYDVTIEGSGKVTFEGRRAVSAVGTHTAYISRAAVGNLVDKFRVAKFFSLPNTRVMDSSSTVSIGFDTHYRWLAGERVPELRDAVEKVAGAARWIGDR